MRLGTNRSGSGELRKNEAAERGSESPTEAGNTG